MSYMAKLMEDGRWVDHVFPASAEWYTVIRKRLDEIWAGTISVDDGLRAATSEGDAKLAEISRR